MAVLVSQLETGGLSNIGGGLLSKETGGFSLSHGVFDI